MKTDLCAAWFWALIICSFMVFFCIGLTNCTGQEEMIREKATRDLAWCNAYCEAQESILIEIRGQSGKSPICICVVGENYPDTESCDLVWD